MPDVAFCGDSAFPRAAVCEVATVMPLQLPGIIIRWDPELPSPAEALEHLGNGAIVYALLGDTSDSFAFSCCLGLKFKVVLRVLLTFFLLYLLYEFPIKGKPKGWRNGFFKFPKASKNEYKFIVFL